MIRIIPALLVILSVAFVHPVSADHNGMASHGAHQHGGKTACGDECETPRAPACCTLFHFFCGIDGVFANRLSVTAVEWVSADHALTAAETLVGLLPEPHIPPPRA
jgi:hypothetical protein